MDSMEQQIVDKLVALLEKVPGIRGAYDGRVTPFNDVELPAANVFTPKTDGLAVNGQLTDHDLNVTIVLHAMDRTAQKTVRALTASLYAALGAAERDPSGPLGLLQVQSISEPSKAVKCIQQGDFIGSAQIAVTITYRTARWGM